MLALRYDRQSKLRTNYFTRYVSEETFGILDLIRELIASNAVITEVYVWQNADIGDKIYSGRYSLLDFINKYAMISLAKDIEHIRLELNNHCCLICDLSGTSLTLSAADSNTKIEDVLAGPGRNGMPKQQLCEYLAVVCDAENAIYSCSRIICALEALKKNAPCAAIPFKPKRACRVQDNEDAAIRYQREMERYEQAYKVFLEVKEIKNKVISIIDQCIVAQKERLICLKQQLAQLYDCNMIQTAFRDIVVVNRLHEYLATGICDTLDGENGAYVQYIQEVCSNRICGSIDEVEKQLDQSTASACASVQSTLYREMQVINRFVFDMQKSIGACFDNLRIGMSEYQKSGANVSDACAERLEGVSDEIRRAIQTNAYNHYITERETNIQGYLLRGTKVKM